MQGDKMLNDTTYISEHDPSGALGFAFDQPGQLEHDFGIANKPFGKDFKNVVFAGMGGSALAAELVKTWPKLRVPFVIAKDYDIPAFVNEDTFVICASYSGNTEETISAIAQAEAAGAQIAVIAHGGKLGDLAKQKDYVYTELPDAPQPRMGIFAAYRATFELLVAAGLAEESGLAELSALSGRLEMAMKAWVPEMSSEDNEAKQLALAMQEKTPIIYAGPLMYPAAYKWKISANENAKNTAWSNAFPELNHNEFIGWSSHPLEKPFVVVDLISHFEHPRTLKRFEVTDRLLEGMKPTALRVEAKGESALEHMLYLVLLGDVATIYLALLNKVDPTPVVLVEQFKKELG